MKLYIYLLFLIFLSSCQKKKISIILLTDNFKSLSYNPNLLAKIDSSYNKFSKSSVRFLIKNNTNNNYLISTNFVKDGHTSLSFFPNYSYELDFLNILVSNKQKIIKPIYLMPDYPYSLSDRCDDLQDLLKVERYNMMGYKNDNYWIYKNYKLTKSLVYLKSNETLFFETYVNLPVNRLRNQYYPLSNNKNYKVNLIINSDTTNIKKYLTWSQLKNIEENNYKLFHGTITSENSVPIVFVD